LIEGKDALVKTHAMKGRERLVAERKKGAVTFQIKLLSPLPWRRRGETDVWGKQSRKGGQPFVGRERKKAMEKKVSISTQALTPRGGRAKREEVMTAGNESPVILRVTKKDGDRREVERKAKLKGLLHDWGIRRIWGGEVSGDLE